MSDSGTIPNAVSGDTRPSNDVERALDRIAADIGADSGTVLETMPGVYDVVGARRFEDFGVEFVYRYQEPVDRDIRAALIASNLDPAEAYMESTFYPIVDRLDVPDAYLIFSYFQPDGEHIISIVCQHVTWEAGKGGWRPEAADESAGSAGSCNESPTLTDGYASGHFVAP